jgi:hypothetical protein
MLYEETDRIIKAYGNHPSFMLMSASHEPKGKWQEALSKWVEHYWREDPRRLYTTGTGHTERELENLTEGTDYLAIHRVGPTKMLRRESGWYGGDYRQSLEDIVTMSGVVLMSRQNSREHEGDIRGYVLQVSDDGREWREVARGELLSTFAPQQIYFSSAVTAKYLKLIALYGFGVDKRTSLAELAVITDTFIKKAKPKPLPPRPKP